MEKFDINEIKKDNHLNLHFGDKVFHYSILIIPIMIIALPIIWLFNKAIDSPTTLILILLLGLLLLYAFYTLQKEKLLFKIIKIDMPDDKIKTLIHNTLNTLKWNFDQPNDRVIIAYIAGFFKLTLRITIIYENSFIYINILDVEGYMTTYGKTTRFYKKFKDQIFKELQESKSRSDYK